MDRRHSTPPPPQRFLDPGSGLDILKQVTKNCKSEQYRSSSQPPGASHPAPSSEAQEAGRGTLLSSGPSTRASSSAAQGAVPTWGALQAGATTRSCRAESTAGWRGDGSRQLPVETETARCFPPSHGDQRQLDEVPQPCPAQTHLPEPLTQPSAQMRPASPEALPPPGAARPARDTLAWDFKVFGQKQDATDT